MKERRTLTAAICTAALLSAGAAFALVADTDRVNQSDRAAQQTTTDAQQVGRKIIIANDAGVPAPTGHLKRVDSSQVAPAGRITTRIPLNAPAQGGIAGDFCGPGNGACFEANGTPGCEDADCCNTVCAEDAFCCDEFGEWDDICAKIAVDNCEGCGTPASGNCCSANGSAYCNDADCCNFVCAQDSFCCDDTWDEICAGIAADEESGCDICQVVDGLFYQNVLEPPGPFPAVVHELDEIIADDLQMVSGGTIGQVFVSTGNADAPSNLLSVDVELHFWNAVVEGGEIFAPVDGEQLATLVGTLDLSGVMGACGSAEAGLPPGCGFLGITWTFDALEVSNVLWAGVRFINPVFSGEGDTNNLFQFLGNAVPTVGASADALWSSTFEGGAIFFFGGDPVANTVWEVGEGVPVEPGVCGEAGTGDCFEANGTPACEDEECCNTVCACDPFCCDTAWDAFCVGPNGDVPGCSATDLCDGKTDPTGGCVISNCPADLDGNGNVGVPDLISLLGCWGPVQPGCEDADFDGNGNIGVPDLIELLGQWGPCDPDDCEILSSDDCDAAGGDYLGDDTTCP